MKLFIVGLSAARNLTVSKAHCYWKRSIIGTFRADNIRPYSGNAMCLKTVNNNSPEGAAFVGQEPDFDVETTGVAGEAAPGAQYPVAGD